MAMTRRSAALLGWMTCLVAGCENPGLRVEVDFSKVRATGVSKIVVAFAQDEIAVDDKPCTTGATEPCLSTTPGELTISFPPIYIGKRTQFDFLLKPRPGESYRDVVVTGELFDENNRRVAASMAAATAVISTSRRSDTRLDFACFNEACSPAGIHDLSLPTLPADVRKYAFDNLLPRATISLRGVGQSRDLVAVDRNNRNIVSLLRSGNWAANTTDDPSNASTLLKLDVGIGEVTGVAVGKVGDHPTGDASDPEDLVLGVYNASFDGPGIGPGVVYVIPGSVLKAQAVGATLLVRDAPGVLRLGSDKVGEQFGGAVSVGDLNNDGKGDLLVGAFNACMGRGAFYFVFPSLQPTSGLVSTSNSVRFLAPREDGSAGPCDVASQAGSGAQLALWTDAGGSVLLAYGVQSANRVYVVNTRSSPGSDIQLADAAHKTLVGDGAFFGSAIAFVDTDADGSGSPLLVVGAPAAEGGSGSKVVGFDSTVLFASEATTTFSVGEGQFDFAIAGASGSKFGAALSQAELTMGSASLLVGAPAFASGRGAAYAFSPEQLAALTPGMTTNLDASLPLLTVLGPSGTQRLGSFVLAGDIGAFNAADEIILGTETGVAYAIKNAGQ